MGRPIINVEHTPEVTATGRQRPRDVELTDGSMCWWVSQANYAYWGISPYTGRERDAREASNEPDYVPNWGKLRKKKALQRRWRYGTI